MPASTDTVALRDASATISWGDRGADEVVRVGRVESVRTDIEYSDAIASPALTHYRYRVGSTVTLEVSGMCRGRWRRLSGAAMGRRSDALLELEAPGAEETAVWRAERSTVAEVAPSPGWRRGTIRLETR